MREIMLVALVMAAGCGPMDAPDAGARPKAPAAGDSCIGLNTASCNGSRAALFCEGSNRFAAYDCAGGCTGNSETTLCSFVGAPAGSACPFAYVSKGQCETNALIVCNAADGGTFGTPGAWSRRPCDGGCAVVGSSIECRP